MSFFTHAWLLERYGPRLNLKQAAEALGFSESTLVNRLSQGTIGLRTYLDGGRRFSDVRDVAEYLDECRAATQASVERNA